jgi:putative ABC transport system permease protein
VDYKESFLEARSSIRQNFLRSLLTLLIIAVGITCLVGILSAIDAILFSFNDNFNKLGANTFRFRPLSQGIKTNNSEEVKYVPITFEQALEFKERFKVSGATVAIDSWASDGATVKYGDKKSNPNIGIRGIDENYFTASSIELEYGRNITATESHKVVIGSEVVKILFDGKNEKALGKEISVNTDKYTVIGVLKSKGASSGGGGSDKVIFIPLLESKFKYGYSDKNYNINVSVANAAMVDNAMNASIGVMRNIRKLNARNENDFEIRKSDSVLQTLKDMTSTLRASTVIIAMLTLLGAAIGLMNIMLVSVTERTKEIGVRKALGATRQDVLSQFLIEAITICLLGGILGIIFGILMGFGVTVLVKGKFVIPWAWILLGLIVCIVVGVVSGLYPALKASRLDPIESLRYE